MGINPNIILGIQQPRFQLADPLESAQKAMSLQALMGQQDLRELQLRQARTAESDDLATREAFKAGGDQKAIIDRLLAAGQYKPAQALQKNMLEAEKSRVGIDKDKVEILNKATAAHRDQLANVNDQQTAAQWVMAGYNDPYLKDVFARAGTPEQAIARIPTDPIKFEEWKQQNALGATEYIKQNKRTIHMQDTGGASNVLSIPGLGGAPTILSSTAKTNTPGELLTDERTRAEGAANRGVQIRGQNMTDARARETNVLTREANATTYDTDRGVLVNRATGEARPAMQNGQPLGPKEKLTDAQKKELASIDSQQNILRGALAEVAKAPDAFSTARGLATLAGAVPESMAGKWMDTPAQREARSYVFNVVSKVINERAGAAQSAQELARLRSFLPAETDNADQIKDKLTSFSSYLENSRAGYDRPQGVRMPGAVPAQPAQQLVPGATRAGPVAQPGGVKFLGFE